MSRTSHVPSMDQIRSDFIEAWAGDFVYGKTAAANYFDQALNGYTLAVESAAEQREAIKALREAAEESRGYEFWPEEWLHERADDLEGDE